MASPLKMDVNVRVTTHSQMFWRAWQSAQRESVAEQRNRTPEEVLEEFLDGGGNLGWAIDTCRR